MPAPAIIQLSALDGTDGFLINGELADDRSGISVASAGDVNGDGFGDLIIGAHRADPNGTSSGASYVVFGQAPGFAASIELSALDGLNGFKINGEAAQDLSGLSVASAGDFNGDGLDDLIIGANFADPNGTYSGASYVVFGRVSGFTADLDLSSLDGTNGFQLNGELLYDRSGFSVASAGDINGDGFEDLIIGARGAGPNGPSSGASYVVFGRASGPGANLNLSTLNGTNGFQVSGEAAFDTSGLSVASAGDVNGDGLDDLIIGAWGADVNGSYSGASYVVFGRASGFAANLNLSTLDGTNGFQINGEVAEDRFGTSVASAGDINGDGFEDLIVGAYRADPNGGSSGASYVVFGQASGFAADFDLATLDGTNGFQINGEEGIDQSGYSVASAGDVNGDGFDDLIVGAFNASPNGLMTGRSAGASYVVFGQASGFGANLNLSTLDGTNGFQINGVAAYDQSGKSVASAGDVNGDGFADLIIGAHYADPNGAGSGASYVLFGSAFGASATPVTPTGTAGAEILIGGIGDDTFTGGGGADVFRGGAGNDSIVLPTAADFADIDGGTGFDTLAFTGAGTTLDLTTTLPAEITSIEAVDLTGSGNNTLVIDRLAALDLTEERVAGVGVIRVTGDAGDAVTFTELGWASDGPVTEGAITYTRYVNGKAEVWVQNGVSATTSLDIDLATLTATDGFRIDGAAAYDRAGISVSSAGDINGDGFDDLIIGADRADPSGRNSAGSSYVIFGKASGFGTIDLATLAAADGFRIDGAYSTDYSGFSVSSAGDVNGDGFDDLIVGSYYADPLGRSDAGTSHVIFGKAAGFGTIDLATPLAATEGFVINGAETADYAGFSVSSAGDVNGDGLDDLIVGAYGADPSGFSKAGSSFVIFGQASGFGEIDLAALTANVGFRIDGAAGDDRSGRAVSSAGDINGDGFDDLIVGARNADPSGLSEAGSSYVIFGRDTGFGTIDLAALAAADGFRIDGAAAYDRSGVSVSSAGDINGDGLDDLVIGASFADPSSGSGAGSSFVVFGKASGFATIDLATLAAADGFRIDGAAPNDQSGTSVSSAGDVNGDGFDDLIVGAYIADPDGRSGAGASYVIFGKASGFATIDLATLDATDGFRIAGADNEDQSGRSVSAAGDVNGDGFDDLMVGASSAGPSGRNYAGSTYVIFGSAFGETTVVTGTAAVDRVIGTTGDDTLTGGGGADVFRGGAGNDRIVLPTAADFADIHGGTGFDTLAFTGSGTTLDLTTTLPAEITSIERVELTGSGNNTLVLDRLAVLDLTEERTAGMDVIRVTGNAGDAVTFSDDGWVYDGADTEGAITYTRYVNGKAEVLVQNGVSVTGATLTLDLATLIATDGFRIDGAASGDRAGVSVSSAGDVNGDGFDDLIIGADLADPYSRGEAGSSYVIFGKASGFGTVDLATLAAADGFRIDGENGFIYSGHSVSSAGDINGDGFDDLIIGAFYAIPPGGVYAGTSHVIFGKAAGFGTIDLATPLAATEGFVISGAGIFDLSGFSVSSAGDVNGDGLDDLIVGAHGADPSNLSRAGSSYVIFGKTSGFGAIDLAALTADAGFRIDGAAAYDESGRAVSSAGDINGDGFDDLIIGARDADPSGLDEAGSSWVIFGRDTGFGTIDLAALAAADGFRIDGAAADDRSGVSVSSAGDINGDGLDDLIIGAERADPNSNDKAGSAYVVFGKTTGFGTIDLATLAPADGFRIDGAALYDYAGSSVSSAGDFNGDGFDDLIVGAPSRYSYGVPTTPGAAYVIFGKASGFAPLDLSTLEATDGFRIVGVDGLDYTGGSVSSAGDINGDGFDDLIVGAEGYNGGNINNTGGSFVIFGTALGQTTVTTGTAVADRVIGTTGDDTLTGGGGADVFRGGAGNDRIVLPTAADLADIHGGTGFDTLAFTGSGTTLDLTTTLPAEITSIERVELTGSGDNTLALDRLAVLDLTEERSAGTAILRVTGNVGDRVRFGDTGWTVAGTVTEGADTFIRYVNDKAEVRASSTLFVDLSGDGDTLTASALADRIDAGAGADSVGGGDSGDNLRGGGDADTLAGDAGNDALYGDAGDDSLTGGADNDYLDGGTGADTMAGGAGNDRYVVDSIDDVVDETGGDGLDSVFASADFTLGAGIENAFVTGTAGVALTGNAAANRIFGSSGADSLAGAAGVDDLRGNAGADTIDGGEGADRLEGGLDNDSIAGGSGTFADAIDGGAGDDTLAGGAGNDRYTVDATGDVIDETDGSGGDAGGRDFVLASADVVLSVFVEDVTLTGAAVQATGNASANVMTGTALDNTLSGLGGIDLLQGLGGHDSLDGGAAADKVYGAAGNDTLIGGDGNDLLDAGTEDDFIDSGLGRDVIRTGTGSDVVAFSGAPVAGFWDTLTDFDVATDALEISAAAFGGGLVANDPVQFVSGAAPTAAGVTGGVFLYNTATGSLVFDVNGELAGGAIEIARFTNLAALSAADFSVVA